MACGSLSFVSCSSASEPSSSVQSLPLRTTTSFISSKPFLPGLRSLSLRVRPLRAVLRQSIKADDDETAEKFRENNAITDFMRFRTGDGSGAGGGSGELQTAVVSYKKQFPWSLLQPFLQVDLVSTIHIADKQYFETLQKGLESYDCVLYEMVASRESLESRRNSKTAKKLRAARSRGFNILGFIQRQMARVLALDFQLDCLDYDGNKWLHADLDFETFKMLQHERGESFFTFARDMTLRSTKALVQSAAIPEDLDPWRSKLLWASRVLPMPLVGLLIIGSVCSPLENQTREYSELKALSQLDIGAALKIFLAKRLTSEFTQITVAIEEKSVIIGERNRAATEALQRAIDNGYKRIAVLYGGGHMPDLGRRLREEFDMVPSQVQWVTAWSIQNRKLDSRSIPFLKTLAKLSGWPLNRYQTLGLLIFSSVLAVDLWFWELFFGTVVHLASWAASEVDLLIQSIRFM
ncbi:hypothetical protein DsansV1_C38g0236331 [Dioscorea sansibarensis]